MNPLSSQHWVCMSDKWSLKHRSKVSTLCLCFKLISWLICGPQRAEIDISNTHKWRKCLENYTLSSGSVLWHIKLLKQLSLLLPSNLRSRCIWEFMFHLLWPNPSGSLSHLNSFPPGIFCTGPIRDVYLIHWGFCMISDISELCLVFTFLRSVLCCSVTLSICKDFSVCLSITPLGNPNQTDRVQTKLLSTFLWPLAFFSFSFLSLSL